MSGRWWVPDKAFWRDDQGDWRLLRQLQCSILQAGGVSGLHYSCLTEGQGESSGFLEVEILEQEGGFLAGWEGQHGPHLCYGSYGARPEVSLSHALHTHLFPHNSRLSLVYRWGKQSSEFNHLPKATLFHKQFVVTRTVTVGLWLFHWPLLPYLMQVSAQMSSERPTLTALKYQQVSHFLPPHFVLFSFLTQSLYSLIANSKCVFYKGGTWSALFTK